MGRNVVIGICIDCAPAVQYVLQSRELLKTEYGIDSARGPYRSPFQSRRWAQFVLLWSVVALVAAVYNIVRRSIQGTIFD